MQRILLRAVGWLPFPLLYGVAWLAYLLLYYVARYRRDVVRSNLERVFPEKTSAEITALGKNFYRHLSRSALEILKARCMSPAEFSERMQLLNPEVIREYTEDFTRSVIVLTIHQGNWEWMLHGAIAELGIPIDPVYKPLHNKAVDDIVFDIRAQFGSRPLSVDESTKDIVKRRKEFRLFVMVADQSPTRHDRSYWTEFLGQESAFFLGAEVIAKMTRFPVVFVQCRRQKPGYYTLEFLPVAAPPYEKEGHAITEQYIEYAEAAIREQPETWLWSNRRWKRDRAVEEAREKAEQSPAS